jgi:hypothetical protein
VLNKDDKERETNRHGQSRQSVRDDMRKMWGEKMSCHHDDAHRITIDRNLYCSVCFQAGGAFEREWKEKYERGFNEWKKEETP